MPAYLEAARLAGRDELPETARDVCRWVLAEMVDPAGGLWSTLDADSEGEEGRFYVWQRDEVLEVLGKGEAKFVDTWFGLGTSENFEGFAWTLRREVTDEEAAKQLGMDVEAARAKGRELGARLFERRTGRVRPGTDDKVLTSWNGLMISALSRAASQLDEPGFLATAQAAARFCLTTMRDDAGRLLAAYRAGQARIGATLADVAYLANGLLDLFEADGDVAWADAALELVEDARARFADRERAGFFFTADDAEGLVARPRDLQDGARPSSNGVMTEVLVRAAELTGRTDLGEEADRLFALVEPLARSAPSAFARLQLALMRRAGVAPTVVLGRGEGYDALRAATLAAPRPGLAVVTVPGEGVPDDAAARYPLLAGKRIEGGAATAWVCRHGTCKAPVTDVDGLVAELAG